ncbi:hypothetical protein [Clostridium sp.]|jgi:hypothetical protein|uniref:hypothetical protein n=1 Tax=Clostridium sp. TaxID=1506 RepID=UPI003EEBFD83
MTEDKRIHRIKADFGNSDYYKHFIKETDCTHISRAKYGVVLREFNNHVRERISTKGAEYFMPLRTGKIELRKIKTEVKLDEEGKVINNLPVNWKATRELWAESDFAKEKKTKIRYTNEHTDGHTFRIFYRTSKANFKNKSIYKMKFNRTLKRDLSKSIFAGRIDAFIK